MLVEIDAWYLPDTEGTSYRRGHLKTTVAPRRSTERASGCATSTTPDYSNCRVRTTAGAFRMLDHFTDDVMDPFTEVVIFDAGPRLEGDELRAAARDLLASTSPGDRRPTPSTPGRGAWSPTCRGCSPAATRTTTKYAFVTVRMVGSAFELFADHVAWTLGEPGEEAAAEFRGIAEASKVVSFRLARRRPFDIPAVLAPLIDGWERGMDLLGADARPMRLGAPARELAEGWTVAATAPGAVAAPDELDAAGLTGAPPPFPAPPRPRSTTRSRLRRRGLVVSLPVRGPGRRSSAVPVLELDGIATVSETYLNGQLVLRSESMWREHAVDVGELTGGRQRAGDRLPRAGAVDGQAPPPRGPLADPRRQQRQPPLVPDDGVRPLARVRARAGGGRALAAGPARAGCRRSPRSR